MLKDISECFLNFIEKLRVHYHYHSLVSPTAHDSGAQLSPHPGGFFSPGRPLPPGESTAYTCDGHVIKIVTLQNVSWKHKWGFYIYEKKITRKGAFCLGYFICLCKISAYQVQSGQIYWAPSNWLRKYSSDTGHWPVPAMVRYSLARMDVLFVFYLLTLDTFETKYVSIFTFFWHLNKLRI